MRKMHETKGDDLRFLTMSPLETTPIPDTTAASRALVFALLAAPLLAGAPCTLRQQQIDWLARQGDGPTGLDGLATAVAVRVAGVCDG